MKKFLLLFLILTTLFTTSVSAHSGKTDSNGGHHDNVNGGYHYHHGYPAHQHINGECPYDMEDNTNEVDNTEITNNTGTLIVSILLIVIFVILAVISIKKYGNILEFPMYAFISIMSLPFLAMYGISWCISYLIKKLLFLLPTKSPCCCKMLERYWLNIDKINKNYIPTDYCIEREFCEVVAESEKYLFYNYQTFPDGSGGYILRRDKKDRDKIYFFGKSQEYNIIFNNYLFQARYRELNGNTQITAKNIDDGSIKEFNWLGGGKIMFVHGHCGRIYNLECIEKMYVEDDKMILEILKDNPYKKETNSKYKIIVTTNKYGDFITKIE